MFLTTILLLFGVMHPCAAVSPYPKIAIVGGGVGGTSCAYFLRQLFAREISLTLFEGKEIGGRLATIEVDGKEYESGSSTFHPTDRHVSDLVRKLGLRQKKRCFGNWGIYDGSSFVFTSSPWTAITLSKLYWRYGLNIFYFNSQLKTILADLSRIYDGQGKGLSFSTVQGLLGYMGQDFNAMTQQTLKDYMAAMQYSNPFVSEFVEAASHGNYGQGTEINAFAGIMSLANSVSETDLWSVKGGNKQLPAGLLRKSHANHVKGDITEIALLEDGTYELTYRPTGTDDEVTEKFDQVVLATPFMSNSNTRIRFRNFTEDFKKHTTLYHRTITTFVSADLNKKFVPFDPLLDTILSSRRGLPFRILTAVYPVSSSETPRKDNVYMMQTELPLSDEQTRSTFTNVKTMNMADWFTHPHYPVPNNIPPFVLHRGLYYINAIEWAASTVEMTAIAANNVALLIYNDLIDRKDRIDKWKKARKEEL